MLDAPERVKPIGYKWVFTKKTNKEGKIVTYKATFVAKGYHQCQDVDYDETFHQLLSIWILLAIAAHYEIEIWQLDVKTTFLNRKYD